MGGQQQKQQVFYTYLFTDPKSGCPIYIGKGQGDRAFAHLQPKCDTRLSRTLKKRMREGFAVEPVIHIEHDEQTALQMEMFWINFYGRADLGLGALLNLTDGGEGTTGMRHTAESKAAIAESSRARPSATIGKAPWNKGTKGLMTAWNKGIKTGIKTSGMTGKTPWNKGRTQQKDTSQAKGPGKGCPGVPKSEEFKQYLSEKMKGRPWSEARRRAQEARSKKED